MVRLYARHNVRDYATWRKAYDSFAPMQKKLGVTAQAVFQSLDNPNDITVWHDFATAEEAKALLASAELKTAMMNAGVQGPPTIWITKQV